MSPAQTRNTELLLTRAWLLLRRRRLVLAAWGYIRQQLLELGDLLLGDVTRGEKMVQQTRVPQKGLD